MSMPILFDHDAGFKVVVGYISEVFFYNLTVMH